MSEFDWLGEPEDAVTPATRAVVDTRKELSLPVPSVAEQEEMKPLMTGEESPEEVLLTLPEAVMTRNELLRKVWPKLGEKQRAFLLALRDSNFSERGAVKALEGTPFEVSRQHVRRQWDRSENFALCRRLLTSDAAQRAMQKDQIVLRAHQVAEEAMEPKPILYHGVPTGFYEINGDVALRANEQIAKIAGHLKNAEAARVRVRIVNLAGPEDDKDVIDGTAVEVEAEVPTFLE